MENKSYLIVSRSHGDKSGHWTVEESDIASLDEAKTIALSFAEQAPKLSIQIWEEIIKVRTRVIIS